MKTVYLSIIFLFITFACAPDLKAQKSIADLKLKHQTILKKWLQSQTGWRLAIENDYDQERLRDFKNAEKVMPFYRAKDFNGDKREDFAVILIRNGKFAVAVFNAPFASKRPSFYSKQIEQDDILYYNKNTKRLLVGPYESDAGFVLIPSGKKYKAESQM